MKTLGETLTALKERWGEHDSDFLLSSEVRTMRPKERERYIEQIVDLYFEAELIDERFMIQAQREAYTEGNCNLYAEN
jgi:hypothetical protein